MAATATTAIPLIDVSLIPLPFLCFHEGELRTANAGARELLQLDVLENDSGGEPVTYNAVFPGGAVRDRHLQDLQARVGGPKGEILRCKAAVYDSQLGKSPEIRSILIVDIAAAASSSFKKLSGQDGMMQVDQDRNKGSIAATASSNSHTAANPRPGYDRATSLNATVSANAPPREASPHRPHLHTSIKRHSGDIKRILTNTIEKKRAERHERHRSASTASAAAQDGEASPTAAAVPSAIAIVDNRSLSEGQGGASLFPIKAPAMQGSLSASSPARTPTSSLHHRRPSEPNIALPTSPWATKSSYVTGAASAGSSSTSPKQTSSTLPPILPTRNSNSGESSAASTRSKASTTFFANAAAAASAETADFGLAQSALAAHPRTGVIISKADLSSGFVNSRTRELLMGIKSPTDEYSTDPFDDMWYAASSTRERQSVDGDDRDGHHSMSGLRHQQRERKESKRSRPTEDMDVDASSSSDDQGTTVDDKGVSPVWEDEIIFEDGKVRIDFPDRGENLQTSISDILRWSLRRRRVRQQHRQLRDDISSVRSGKSGSVVSPPASIAASASSGAPSGPRASHPMTAREAEQIMKVLKEEEKPWLASKPYKVYDASFSQRVEDPFEQLFDQTVRRGEHPAADQSIIVGIETEVGPAEQCGFPENECFIHALESGGSIVRRRVRRRVVQARASPLKDMNGDHIGGVVWLRDITGESGAPAPSPTVVVPDAVDGSTSSLVGALHPPGSATPAVSGAGATPGFQGPAGMDGGTFWQHVINNMAQMVWVTTPDGNHIYFNNQWYSYTGLQPEQSLGVNWQNPFHHEDMPEARKRWSRSLATGEPYSVEYRCRRHDGVWRWQLGRAQALLDTSGKPVAWMGTCTDMEDIVSTRRQLADTTENLRRVIDLANVMLLCCDRDFNILLIEGGTAIRGETSVVGKPLSHLIKNEDVFARARDILSGSADMVRVTFESSPGAGVWFGCLITPLRKVAGDAIEGVVIVMTDITDVKEAEEALKKSNEEQSRLLASETAAKEASRLKSEFTANLSHEIRTPITGMLGMSELLLEEDLTPSQHESVRKILKSGEILLKMVGDVLDIGKVEAGKLELDIQPFYLRDLMTDASVMFRTAANKKGLTFNEDTTNLYQGEVLGDLPRMRQVLLNFLANSVKFTKQGFITLRVRQEEETPTSIRMRFVVEDSGIGIAKNVLPILFQAFQQADSTTSREHGGTGLGLLISKSLIELMNGTVNLESDLGKGTKITVIVPFAKSARSAAEVLRRPSQRSRGSASSNSSLTAAATSPDMAPQRNPSDDARSSRGAPSPDPSELEDSVMMAATAANQQSSLTGAGVAGAVAGANNPAQAAAAGADAVGSPTPLTVPGVAASKPAGPLRTLSQKQTSFAPVTSLSHSSPDAHSPPLFADVKQEGLQASGPQPLDRSSIWILLAEDNALNAEIFTRGMTRMGFNVKAVVNGQEFLDAVTERDWDLALLDCHMPVMDGYEAVGRLRQHADKKKRELVVIALTASAISGDREKCLDAGMTDYLSKPVRLKVLENTILSYLERAR